MHLTLSGGHNPAKLNLWRWLLLIAAVLTLKLMTNVEAAESPQVPLTVMPTPADQELLKRFDAIYKQLDSTDSPGRETLNSLRSRRLEHYRSTLAAREPVDAESLRRARRWFGYVLPQLEAAGRVQPPQKHYVAFRKGAISIDGQLNEVAWRNAIPIPIQYLPFDKVKAPAHARLLWDQQFLYVGFEVVDTNIIAPELKRDEEIWKHDCVEIYLMPDKETRVYWEIEISPTGSIFDSLSTKHLSEWGDDMQLEATVQGLQIGRTVRGTPNKTDDRDAGYTVEFAIPLEQLPGLAKNPQPGEQIYGLLCIVNRDSENPRARTQSLAQVPYVSWFHNIWAFQLWILSGQ